MASVYKAISKSNAKRQKALAALDDVERNGVMMESATLEELIDEAGDTSSEEEEDEDGREDEDDEEEEEEEDDNMEDLEQNDSAHKQRLEATDGLSLGKSTSKAGDAKRGVSSESRSQFLPKTRVLMLTSRGVTHRYVLGVD
jgi:hypothetical protein